MVKSNKELVLKELRFNENLLPESITSNTNSMSTLVVILQDILKNHHKELGREELFQSNYINIINYIYLDTFRRKKEHRNKNIFSQAFLDKVFSLPKPVTR